METDLGWKTGGYNVHKPEPTALQGGGSIGRVLKPPALVHFTAQTSRQCLLDVDATDRSGSLSLAV